MSKEKLVMWVVGMLLERLSGDELKHWVDVGMDLLETKVVESPNKYDDMVVLPICKLVRATFNVPDND